MTADPPSITFGHDESWDCWGSESGAHGEALLADVGACVPLTPDLGRSEHASATAHVAEGSLARAVGTTSPDTGDTGDGTSCTPRFSTGLVTWKNGRYQKVHIKFVDVFNKITHKLAIWPTFLQSNVQNPILLSIILTLWKLSEILSHQSNVWAEAVQLILILGFPWKFA